MTMVGSQKTPEPNKFQSKLKKTDSTNYNTTAKKPVEQSNGADEFDEMFNKFNQSQIVEIPEEAKIGAETDRPRNSLL